jgi:hypothetical protein
MNEVVSSPRMDRVARIAVVTAGLSLTGGVIGAVCAASAAGVLMIIEAGVRAFFSHATLQLLGPAMGFGFVVGAVGAPILAWGLLRRVPLGRAILVTACGTVLGAIAGELVRPFQYLTHGVPGFLAGAFAGFVVAGVGLWIHARTHAKTGAAP